jgi:3D (Asp-Asp-Asp) domain-containing protein
VDVKKTALVFLLLIAILLSGCAHTKSKGCKSGTVEMSVSAYAVSGKTTSGKQTRPGVCACGPSYPFGTIFIVPELGVFVCQDHGSKVGDSNLDIWVPSEKIAEKWGRKTLKVRVICP